MIKTKLQKAFEAKFTAMDFAMYSTNMYKTHSRKLVLYLANSRRLRA
jgi:hypothetical protein